MDIGQSHLRTIQYSTCCNTVQWYKYSLELSINIVPACIGDACRTDCIFSPDDKLVITGTSVKKGDGVGKLVFLDRQTLKIAAELDVAPESASLASLSVVV